VAFAVGGIALAAAGGLLLVFLAGAGVPQGLPIKNHAAVEDRAAVENRAAAQDEAPHAARGSSLSCILPIFASLIVFWRNSFTDKLFLTTLNINFPPGFNLTSLTLIIALPVFGFMASLWWRRFLKEYIRLSAFLFVLSPCLLLLSHSQTLFLVLHTLNVTIILMMIVIFPFSILDLYWQKTRRPDGRGYWAWLLAAAIYILNANALTLTGPFRALSLENGYAVVLLSLAAIAFYLLSRPIFLSNPQDKLQEIAAPVAVATAAATAVAAPVAAATALNLTDILSAYDLSERETEVALLMAQEGLGYKEMGERLYISPLTIKVHVSHVFQKTGVKKRAEFMAKVLNK
jgi:DNA-binding CsgD family transcriptional regulator